MLKLAPSLPDPVSLEAYASSARLSEVDLDLLQPWEVTYTGEDLWSLYYLQMHLVSIFFSPPLGYLSWKCYCFDVAYRTSYNLLQLLQDFKVIMYIFPSSIYCPEVFLVSAPFMVRAPLTYGSDILDSCRPDFKGVIKPGKSWRSPGQKIHWHFCSCPKKANILQWSPRGGLCSSKNSFRKCCCSLQT